MNSANRTPRLSAVLLMWIWSVTLLHITAQDSLIIDYDRLSWTDIVDKEEDLSIGKIVSAGRILQEVTELPITSFVITAEEIRKNNYITLADALKSLPGIRVSQPGNGLEGETFLMRGLFGNSYAKILIDDWPIKPFVVRGMPIGAQLPIQQAERIEVIYGPSAVLYGADASAGVINIITGKSDKPFSVDADLSIGPDDYSNISLSLSGKIGRDKNIINFRIYGNNTSMRDRRIQHSNDTLFNPLPYAQRLGVTPQRYLDNPNYRGTLEEINFQNLPHTSSMIGFDAFIRKFSVSYRSMSRRDHSSLGLSPYNYAYVNPLNFIGEDIDDIRVTYQSQKPGLGLRTTAGVLFYELDNRSSYTYVNDLLIEAFRFSNVGHPSLDSLSTAFFDKYFSRSRFSFSQSTQVQLEQLVNFRTGDRLNWLTGAKLLAGDGSPIVNYSAVPLVEADNGSFRGNPTGVSKVDFSYSGIDVFAQGSYTSEKFNALVGGSFSQIFDNENQVSFSTFNPRIAALYKLSDHLNVRVSYGTSFLAPSPYYVSSTYILLPARVDTLPVGNNQLDPEKTKSFEAGIRYWKNDKLSLDITFFQSKTTGFITYSSRAGHQNDIFIVGYFNEESTFARLTGVQARLLWRDALPSIGLDIDISAQYSKGEENYFNSDTELIADIDGLRGYPDFMGHVRIGVSPIPKLTIQLDNTFMTNSVTRNSLRLQLETDRRNPGFYTMDAVLNYRVTSSLLLYSRWMNVFNAEYAGIDADSKPDILFYNPQSLRIFRVGMNYTLN